MPWRRSKRGQAAFTGRWRINYFPILLPKCLNSRAGDNDSVGRNVSNHEDLSSIFQHPLKKKKKPGMGVSVTPAPEGRHRPPEISDQPA